VDLLLTHAYFLHDDPIERAVMKPYPPLGLLYLTSHLRRAGVDVQVFDATFETFDSFVRVMQRERPSVVGIYCTLMTRVSALRMIGAAKAQGARVVVGGPEPTNYAAEYLSHGADVVVNGEGEITMEALLPALAARDAHRLHDVLGVTFLDEAGAVVHNAPRPVIANLDEQPLPARDAIDLGRYVRTWRTHHGLGSVSLITARGCPFRCNWCSHSVFGHTHRRRSPARVADEVEEILARWKPDQLWYADDVFTINRKWLSAYADELTGRGIRVPFETITREDRLDEQVVQTLARMGCRRLWIGAESGSQRVLDRMERQTDAARMREMIRLVKHHGIATGTFVMLGYEGEAEDDLIETVTHLEDALPDVVLTTLAYPIKGTPYHAQVTDRVASLRAWAEGSDRDLTVLGRHSRRYYMFATRWMLARVELARAVRERRGDLRELRRIAALRAGAALGRAGMVLTRHEREDGQPAPAPSPSMHELLRASRDIARDVFQRRWSTTTK